MVIAGTHPLCLSEGRRSLAYSTRVVVMKWLLMVCINTPRKKCALKLVACPHAWPFAHAPSTIAWSIRGGRSQQWALALRWHLSGFEVDLQLEAPGVGLRTLLVTYDGLGLVGLDG